MNSTAYVLHVVVAFAAVAFLVVPALFLELAARTYDVAFIRKAYGLMSFHGRIGGPLALLILPVGIWLALAYGIPLTSGWLVVSYVVYGALIATGIGYHMRREMKIGSLAGASPDGAPSAGLLAAIKDPLATPMMIFSPILWIVLIWLMVVRPF